MGLSRKLNSRVTANSLLESVVALCIISICLCMAMIIFSAVLTPKSSPKYYNSQNKANELFYLSQLQLDSIYNQAENITIEEEPVNNNLKKMVVKYKDSTQIEFEKKFYLLNNEKE